MAARKEHDADSAPSGEAPGADEVQKQMDDDLAKGFHGVKVDPLPNEAYSLETGPESPPNFPDHTTRAAQHSAVADDTDRSK